MSIAAWIFKTEPSVYSLDDLKRERRCRWDGVRNFQARNFLRDQVALGAPVALWHSNCKATGVVGLGKIVRTAYPDPTAFDRSHPAYDPKSKPEAPTWYSVDLAYVSSLAAVLPVARLRDEAALGGLLLFRQGRLSVSPVEGPAWKRLSQLAFWG